MINLKSEPLKAGQRFEEIAIAALIDVVLDRAPLSGRAVMRLIDGTGGSAQLTRWRRGTVVPRVDTFARIMRAVGLAPSIGVACFLHVTARLQESDSLDAERARSLTRERLDRTLKARALDVVELWIERNEHRLDLMSSNVGSLACIILREHVTSEGASLIDVWTIRRALSSLIDQHITSTSKGETA